MIQAKWRATLMCPRLALNLSKAAGDLNSKLRSETPSDERGFLGSVLFHSSLSEAVCRIASAHFPLLERIP